MVKSEEVLLTGIKIRLKVSPVVLERAMKTHSIIVLLIIGFAVSLLQCEDAEGQLFRRFRRLQSNNNNTGQPIPARQPVFDASQYQYTNPAKPVTGIPSGNQAADSSSPKMPPTATAGQAAPQYQLVTFYDPRTGRTFQRRVLVSPPPNQARSAIAATDKPNPNTGSQIPEPPSLNPNGTKKVDSTVGSVAKIGSTENGKSSVVQSSFDDRGVSLLPLSGSNDAPAKGKIATRPSVAKADAEKVVEYSILVREPQRSNESPKAIETPKPDAATAEVIEYDFPALNAAGEKRNRD
jgi:hypothetical protein